MTTTELYQEAQSLFIQGKTHESITHFTEALESGYDPKTSHLGRGTAYFQLNELDKAIDDFNSIIKDDRSYERAFYYRARQS